MSILYIAPTASAVKSYWSGTSWPLNEHTSGLIDDHVIDNLHRLDRYYWGQLILVQEKSNSLDYLDSRLLPHYQGIYTWERIGDGNICFVNVKTGDRRRIAKSHRAYVKNKDGSFKINPPTVDELKEMISRYSARYETVETIDKIQKTVSSFAPDKMKRLDQFLAMQ